MLSMLDSIIGICRFTYDVYATEKCHQVFCCETTDAHRCPQCGEVLRNGHSHSGERPIGWERHIGSPDMHGGSNKNTIHNTRQQTDLYPGLPYTESIGQ